MRFSQQREKIREIVYDTNSHPTADWVYSQVKKTIPNISLGTVYRNLKQLESTSDLKTIFDGNIAKYDWNTNTHNNLKCKHCGDLIDIALTNQKFFSKIKKDFKFEVDVVEMTIIGSCKKHAKNRNNYGK